LSARPETGLIKEDALTSFIFSIMFGATGISVEPFPPKYLACPL